MARHAKLTSSLKKNLCSGSSTHDRSHCLADAENATKAVESVVVCSLAHARGLARAMQRTETVLYLITSVSHHNIPLFFKMTYGQSFNLF